MVWVVSLLTMDFSAQCLTPVLICLGIQSLIEFGTLWQALAHSVLYPLDTSTRLALKLFRRKRAISEFGWLFTPNHNSSLPFSQTRVQSSVKCYLYFNLVITRSLGFASNTLYLQPYSDSVSLRLRDSYLLILHNILTRRLPLQKTRHHIPMYALTACKLSVSGSISLP